MFTTQAKAQTSSTWYNQNFGEWYLKVYDNSNPQEIFGERYTAAQVQWIMYSIPGLIFNSILGGNTNWGSCWVLFFATKTISIDTCAKGVDDYVKKLANILTPIKVIPSNTVNPNSQTMLKQLFNNDRLLSGITYFRNIGKNLHIIPETQAASGFGYTALQPVVDLWKATRNFAYAIFVIAIIVFAFMIMFKVKINPQTVITIQSALPKVIIAMILVTFSFAIAGFVVDLMYIIMGFLSLMLGPFWWAKTDPNFTYLYISGSFWEWAPVVGPVVSGPVTILIYFVVLLVSYLLAVVFATISSVVAFDLGSSIVGLCLIVFTIILAIIMVINLFRTIVTLFKAFAQIFLLTIVGPIQIALGVLVPQMGFGAWLRSLMANVLVFPAVGLFFFLAQSFILRSFVVSASVLGENNFVVETVKSFAKIFGSQDPALTGLGIWSPPFLGPGAVSYVYILIGLTFIMIIPKVGKMIESFFGGKPFDFETAIGEATGPLKTAGGWVSKAAIEKGTPGISTAVLSALKKMKIEDRGAAKLLYNVLRGAGGQEVKPRGPSEVESPAEKRQ
jgi:hypothetical protein